MHFERFNDSLQPQHNAVGFLQSYWRAISRKVRSKVVINSRELYFIALFQHFWNI